MTLTIDVGNSRVKWAEWQAGEIIVSGAGGYDKKNLLLSLDGLFDGLRKPSVVYSVCVAGDEISQVLSQWVKQHWKLDVDYLVTNKRFNNIVHGYEDPLEHGADRWAAVVAAESLYSSVSLCVIGAGTAITVDFLKHDGQHLGGFIFPSYVSMCSTLAGDTANVSSGLDDLGSSNMSFDVKMDSIPDNTSDAVKHGLHRLLQAGVQSFCKQAKHVLGDSVQIIITGGFAGTILSYPNMPEMHYEPDLVMLGLYRIKTTKP